MRDLAIFARGNLPTSHHLVGHRVERAAVARLNSSAQFLARHAVAIAVEIVWIARVLL